MKLVKTIEKKIEKLKSKSIELTEELKKDLDSTHTILQFGLAKKAEQITVIEKQLELLYEIQEELLHELSN